MVTRVAGRMIQPFHIVKVKYSYFQINKSYIKHAFFYYWEGEFTQSELKEALNKELKERCFSQEKEFEMIHSIDTVDRLEK